MPEANDVEFFILGIPVVSAILQSSHSRLRLGFAAPGILGVPAEK